MRKHSFPKDLRELLQRLYVWCYAAFQCRRARRAICLYLMALLAFTGASLSLLRVRAASEIDHSIQASTNSQQYAIPLTIGSNSVTLTLRTRSADYQLGQASAAPTDYRCLRRRVVTTVPVLSAAGVSAGTLTVTLDQVDQNAVVYFSSTADCDVDAVLTAETPQEPSVRSVKSSDDSFAAAHAGVKGQPYDAYAANYIEAGSFHLYTSRIDRLTSLGSTVYTCAKPSQGVTLSRSGMMLSASIPLRAAQNTQTTAFAVLTADPLANWNKSAAVSAALTLDTGSNNFHLLSNGVYLYEPTTYRPYETGSSAPHIYLSAAAWLLGPCTDANTGPMFETLGKSILYTYLDRINQAGFIPTAPSSTWLTQGYDINGGFYDTRFNFDTVRRLLYAGKAWNDPAIPRAVNQMLRFYLQYANGTAFTVNGLRFVPDYGQPEPDTLSKPKASPSCSLNHYLTEGSFLLRVGRYYHNQQFIDNGLSILKTIEKSASRWIRPTGDLWYSIRPDGQMEKTDYLDVTYADLCGTLALLEKMDISDQYPGLLSLYNSKRDWLIRAGYPQIASAYSPHTTTDPADDAAESIMMSQPSWQLPFNLLYPLLNTQMRQQLLQMNTAGTTQTTAAQQAGNPKGD